jgi:ketopantoate hydroxymethyltransferase
MLDSSRFESCIPEAHYETRTSVIVTVVAVTVVVLVPVVEVVVAVSAIVLVVAVTVVVVVTDAVVVTAHATPIVLSDFRLHISQAQTRAGVETATAMVTATEAWTLKVMVSSAMATVPLRAPPKRWKMEDKAHTPTGTRRKETRQRKFGLQNH